jgi:hypothetical protein
MIIGFIDFVSIALCFLVILQWLYHLLLIHAPLPRYFYALGAWGLGGIALVDVVEGHWFLAFTEACLALHMFRAWKERDEELWPTP